MLLSLLDPRQNPAWKDGTFRCQDGEWQHLSYLELVKRILAALEGAEEEPYGLNKYDPDFIYRSKKVPDVTVAQLIDAARVAAEFLGGA